MSNLEALYPQSFLHILASLLIALAIVGMVLSLRQNLRSHLTRMSAILLVAALTLFSDHYLTYFVCLFIIATAVTNLEFLQNLAAIIRGSKSFFDYKIAESGNIKTPEEDKAPERHPLEYKILNTLWIKQVNRYPDLSCAFTFRLNTNAKEYLEYRQVSSKLIGEGLISESETGQVYLTRNGLQFCMGHYTEFSDEMWLSRETLEKEKIEILSKVLAQIK